MHRHMLATLAVALLFGCAAPGVLPMKEHGAHYQTANDGKSRVYVYREKDFVGSGRGIYILADGQRIGGVNAGTYFVHVVDPGKEVTITAENSLSDADAVNRKLVTAANHSYYIRASLKTGVWDAMPYIEIVAEQEGAQAIQGLSYQTVDSAYRKTGL